MKTRESLDSIIIYFDKILSLCREELGKNDAPDRIRNCLKFVTSDVVSVRELVRNRRCEEYE